MPTKRRKNACFDEDVVHVLNSSIRKRDKLAVNRRIDLNEVNDFLHTLRTYTEQPLFSRFSISKRDETISVSHTITKPSDQLLNLSLDSTRVSSVIVNLMVLTQDYTWRTKDTYLDGWKEMEIISLNDGSTKYATNNDRINRNISTPDLIQLVLNNMDPLQKFILKEQNGYLHTIRCDELNYNNNKNNSFELIISVEVAKRYKFGHERDLVSMNDFNLKYYNWQYMNDFSRLETTIEDITFWACLFLTQEQDDQLDVLRLRVISEVIESERKSKQYIRDQNRLNHNFSSTRSNENESSEEIKNNIIALQCGNRVSLLRVRHSIYMDGRARYALARATLHDRGLLRYNASRRPNEFKLPEDKIEKVNEDKKLLTYETKNVPRIILYLGIDILFASLGFLYLLRLRQDGADVDDVVGVTVAIVGAIFTIPSIPLIYNLVTGKLDTQKLFRSKRELKATELYEQSEEIHDVQSKIEVLSSEQGLAYYNDKGLSFLNLNQFKFQGHNKFPSIFNLSHLLKLGYVTTFARDGTEVLVRFNSNANSFDYFKIISVSTAGCIEFKQVNNIYFDRELNLNNNNQGENELSITNRDLMLEILPTDVVCGLWLDSPDVGPLPTSADALSHSSNRQRQRPAANNNNNNRNNNSHNNVGSMAFSELSGDGVV